MTGGLALPFPYALFLGAADQLSVKTATGIAHWRPERCVAQVDAQLGEAMHQRILEIRMAQHRTEHEARERGPVACAAFSTKFLSRTDAASSPSRKKE